MVLLYQDKRNKKKKNIGDGENENKVTQSSQKNY